MRRDTPKNFDILFQMRLLFYSLIVPAAVGISYILGTLLPNQLSEPGSPLMQSLAIIGTLLLVITFYGVLSKRFGKPGRIGTVIHIISANIGTILVIVHSGGTIFATPGSLDYPFIYNYAFRRHAPYRYAFELFQNFWHQTSRFYVSGRKYSNRVKKNYFLQRRFTCSI